MRCCLAQTRSFAGDIEKNVARHLHLVEAAVAIDADIVIFPELSITGYEPALAGKLAIYSDDERFHPFQAISDTYNITIGIGAPVNMEEGVTIGMLLFQPGQKRNVYHKQYLHPDEEPFFIEGKNEIKLLKGNVALAICYELSVPAHAENAFENGARMYWASVAKTADGVSKAQERLAAIARQSAAPVLMVNCIGLLDGMECAGCSSVWNQQGELTGQLNGICEGLLLLDTDTGSVTEQYL